MGKKYYIIGGVIVLLLILLAGVYLFPGNQKPPPSDEKIEITWWKTFEDTENVSDLIADYTAVNENVVINFVKKDAATYEQDLVNALASGSGPDIFSIHNDWLSKHEAKIAPIPDTIISLRTYKDSFADVAFNDFVKDNKIYAVPLSIDVLALYYNKDILGSSGISVPATTWPELVQNVEKITKVSKTGVFSRSGIALGTANNVNRSVDILTLMMLQNGTKFYSDDFSTALFDQTAENSDGFNPGLTALNFYTQFADPSKKSYTWNVKSDFSVDAFTQSKVGMMISYQYMQPLIRSKAPTLNWGVVPIPQFSEETTKINFANYWGEAVSKNSKNQLAAADFLRFISTKEELTKYYARHKLVASRKDILQSQIGDTEIGVFAEGALTARSVYKRDANVFESVFTQAINDVILKSSEPDVALRDAVQKINFNLRQQ